MRVAHQALTAVVLMSCSIHAADKSGVSATKISLPKGPGSIEGLGESFQPTLNTGTAKYSVALQLPPGTAGHAPKLMLTYDGGGANGILGFGWSLPLQNIQRRSDKGIPLYGDTSLLGRSDIFINDLREELVPVSEGYWFCKNEGAFIRYRRWEDTWEVTTPEGTKLLLGGSASSRVQSGPDDSPRIFSWWIERETDTRGNTITYQYGSFPGDENQHQKYLTGIRYGPQAPPWSHFHFVHFIYEDRRDWFEDCRPGFPIRTGKRLKSLVIGTQGAALDGHLEGDFNQDGTPDHLVRRYDLEYLDATESAVHGSLLARVVVVGADGQTSLPPISFGYHVSNPPAEIALGEEAIGGENEPAVVMDQELVDFNDLNGDGLPDLLKTEFGGRHFAYLNRGEHGPAGSRRIVWSPGVEMDSESGDAQNFSLSSDATHLADMDGDGLADLVHRVSADSVFYFPNRGTAAWGERHLLSVEEEAPPAPFGQGNVRTADLDFDKRTDILESLPTGSGFDYRVWFNIAAQQYSVLKTISQEHGFDFSKAAVHIADLNGDRVPDLAEITPGSILLTCGLGYGRFARLQTIPIPDGPLEDDLVSRAQLQDLNGDGLADLVIDHAPDGSLWYWINRGTFELSARRRITGLPARISPNTTKRWADINGNGTTDLIYADSQAEIAGLPRLQSLDLGRIINGGATPNALVMIRNGIGRVTWIGYQASTEFALADAEAGRPWPDPMPFPVQVVGSVTNLDSLGHAYITRFAYHDGYYDPVEKQFRGFARVEQFDLGDSSTPTLITRSSFHTGRDSEPMKGKLLRLTAEQEDRRIFWDEITEWTPSPRILHTGTDERLVQYVHPVRRQKEVLELGQGTPRRLESELAYDEFGNQTLQADYGVVEGADRLAWADERITTTEYALNPNLWLLRHPARVEIQGPTNHVISRKEFFYDDETFSGNNFGQIAIGNLTLTREWIDPADPTRFIATARTTYDAYGNPTRLLDPLGSAAQGVVDLSQGHAREFAYDPQFHTYLIQETVHLGDGSAPLLFQAAYDAGFGTLTRSRDFNDNETTYGYEALARLTHIIKPGDTPAHPTVEYGYALAVSTPAGLVNFIETRQLDRSSGAAGSKRDHYFISRQFVDGLGRKLMTKTEAEPTEGDASSPRVVVSEATLFNARQQPARILTPFFAAGNGLSAASLDDLLSYEPIESSGWQGRFHNEGGLVLLDLASAHAARTDYDATLRPTQVTNPDGTFRRTVYEPLVTRSFDENDTDPASPYYDTPMVHHNDGLGRLVEVDEITRLTDEGLPAGELRIWTTRYEYDLNDNLTHLTDSQGNQKWFRYDGLKRKLFMNDPDRGVMEYAYDDASNLLSTLDAKSQRITYTYDGVNRLRTEKYHDDLPSPPWRHDSPLPEGEGQGEGATYSVVYHYDTPYPNLPQGDGTIATARNTKGMLSWVEDLSGEEHTSYDQRGRVESVVKRIPDPELLSRFTNHASLVSYRTAFAYDSLDRLTELTYPDNDAVGYEYNARNLLNRITGGPSGSIISAIAYRASDQLAQIDYGNGVRTTYDYDPRLRLTSLATLSHQMGEGLGVRELVHFQYDFDGVSNIRQITDARPAASVPSGDPRRNTQIFAYDDLYRITRAQYSFAAPSPGGEGGSISNDGVIAYRYDRIGNMLEQTSSIEHNEKGLPVADLGQMSSGGSAGRFNRQGRAANDPPGPHALTSIANPKSQIANREYPYDANGNMTVIDGLTNTWDFKDRLIAVESAEMCAEYTYDYTDRRIIKNVHHKPGVTNHAPRLTTVYVNKYFEVREHDAPTKYVWNGETRVARVTGSLSTNQRVQRLRLWPGWNLCSLAVTGSPLHLGEGAGVRAAFKWDQPTLTCLPLTTNETLGAGTVLWLHATSNATLVVTGAYTPPEDSTMPTGPSFQPGGGLEALPLLGVRADVPLWKFDGPSQTWLGRYGTNLSGQTDFPATLAVGGGFMARADVLATLEVPESALRIRYYHQDHLGSSSCLSDRIGEVLGENAFYPFGQARREYKPRRIGEEYMFTQKEQDLETSLSYFEMRYLTGTVGRFCGLDPLASSPKREWLKQPQKMNLYAYCDNNPQASIDPSGLDSEDTIPDIGKAVAASERANPLGTSPRGSCGRGVANSLKEGGFPAPNIGADANRYPSFLPDLGFGVMDIEPWDAKPGDIGVIKPPVGADASPSQIARDARFPNKPQWVHDGKLTSNHPGHVTINTPSGWKSDGHQNDRPDRLGGFYPGSQYEKLQPSYTIYRYIGPMCVNLGTKHPDSPLQ